MKNKKKCNCERLKEAARDHEIKKVKFQHTIQYSLCVVEGIESRIFYCPWCGGLLCQ